MESTVSSYTYRYILRLIPLCHRCASCSTPSNATLLMLVLLLCVH